MSRTRAYALCCPLCLGPRLGSRTLCGECALAKLRWLTLVIAMLATSLGCPTQSTLVGAPTASSSLVVGVGKPRPPLSGEAPFEDTLQLLRDPVNSNFAPGPNGMIAVMKADSQHHPRLYILMPSGPDSIRLLIDRWATTPRWAPSGERIACKVWKSRRRPRELCIVSLGKPDTLYPLPGTNAVRYRWSPDARYLAVNGTLEGGVASVLYLVDTSTGQASALDTLPVYSNYDIGWSPDSRTFAVSRPIRLAEMEDVLESELWVFDVAGRHARVVPADGRAHHTPRWVDGKRLLFRRESPTTRAGETLVVDIQYAKAP